MLRSIISHSSLLITLLICIQLSRSSSSLFHPTSFNRAVQRNLLPSSVFLFGLALSQHLLLCGCIPPSYYHIITTPSIIFAHSSPLESNINVPWPNSFSRRRGAAHPPQIQRFNQPSPTNFSSLSLLGEPSSKYRSRSPTNTFQVFTLFDLFS